MIAVQTVLLHSKVKLGVDISAAAGPVGRSGSADTDAYMRSEILSYSRARGAFAGISLEGSTLPVRITAPTAIFTARSVSARDIVRGSEFPTPEAARGLVALLDHASPTLNRS